MTTAAMEQPDMKGSSTSVVEISADGVMGARERATCCDTQGCCDGAPRLRLAADKATELAAMLKAVAHPVRLQMVDLLSRHAGDVCVCDIESQFELKQPTISHHLKILRNAHIIDCQRQGSWLYYYIRPEAMATLRGLLSEWTEQISAH